MYDGLRQEVHEKRIGHTNRIGHTVRGELVEPPALNREPFDRSDYVETLDGIGAQGEREKIDPINNGVIR